MKFLLTALVFASSLVIAHADIQSPPGADYGPTKKFGRGLSNIVSAATELPYQIAVVNTQSGNSAASGYGVTRGVTRTVSRVGFGVFEIVTFPFPTTKGKYTPPYPSNIRWPHRGWSEYAPELGWESRFPYVREP